jgi:16S rRNA (uracil1498-N3)-methyltransferase
MIATCTDDHRQRIKNIYTPQQDALILIGPEGDFSHDEMMAARAAGFVPVSLGESRLRTETAALMACHTIHLLNR